METKKVNKKSFFSNHLIKKYINYLQKENCKILYLSNIFTKNVSNKKSQTIIKRI